MDDPLAVFADDFVADFLRRLFNKRTIVIDMRTIKPWRRVSEIDGIRTIGRNILAASHLNKVTVQPRLIFFVYRNDR
ncbi:hypothetical protein D3C84_991320 [compost metagenome]